MLTEYELIDRVLSGDRDAYKPLVERHHKGLCIYLVNILHDEFYAEDIAQEAFVRAYEKLGSFKKEYAFSTWLYRIARNLALRYLEVKAKNPQPTELKPELDIIEINSTDDDSEYDLAALKKAIRAIKPEYQEVINLYYWNQKSYEEIAEILKCPVNTVRTWLLRAKQSIRMELHEQF